jgi:hypothetical protein
MMSSVPEEVNPTDPEYEAERGRVPLWLDAAVVRLLATTCICGQPDGSGRHEQFCEHVRWRADAALHKAGLKH